MHGLIWAASPLFLTFFTWGVVCTTLVGIDSVWSIAGKNDSDLGGRMVGRCRRLTELVWGKEEMVMGVAVYSAWGW